MRHALLALFLAGSAALSAGEARWGLQGTVSSSQGDLKDLTSDAGFGAGVFVDFDLGHGHVLRPRFDYVYYPEKTSTETGVINGQSTKFSVKWSTNNAAYGMDYLYYFEGRPMGGHLILGLDGSRYEIKATSSETAGSNTASDSFRGKSSTKLGYVVGMGYDWPNHWGLNVRYTSVKIDDGNFNAINAGLTYHF